MICALFERLASKRSNFRAGVRQLWIHDKHGIGYLTRNALQILLSEPDKTVEEHTEGKRQKDGQREC